MESVVDIKNKWRIKMQKIALMIRLIIYFLKEGILYSNILHLALLASFIMF